jgi:hypothetical protein
LAEVITEQDGKVRYIRLNRPEKMNAINQALAWGTLHAIEDAQADENTWVIGLRICREITRPIRLLLGTASGVARRSNTGVFSLLAPCWQHPSTPSVLGGVFRGRP